MELRDLVYLSLNVVGAALLVFAVIRFMRFMLAKEEKKNAEITSESKEDRIRKNAKIASELVITRQAVPQEWRTDILAALKGSDVIARRSAALAVRSFRGNDIEDAIMAAMQDVDANVRCAAAISLWRLKGEQARSKLEDLLAIEKSEFVRNNVKGVIEGHGT